MSKLGIVNYQVLRSPCTTPPRVYYDVIRVAQAEAVNTLLRLVSPKGKMAASAGKVTAVFVRTQTEAETLQAKLGDRWAIYTGRMNPVERAQVMADLVDGKYDGVVGTSALSTGIDLTFFEFIIFLEIPYDMMTYIQGTGRGGRGSVVCKTLLIWSSADIPYSKGPLTPQDHEGCQAMVDYILKDHMCFRTPLIAQFDEITMDCFSAPGVVHCRKCADRLVCAVIYSSIICVSCASSFPALDDWSRIGRLTVFSHPDIRPSFITCDVDRDGHACACSSGKHLGLVVCLLIHFNF